MRPWNWFPLVRGLTAEKPVCVTLKKFSDPPVIGGWFPPSQVDSPLLWRISVVTMGIITLSESPYLPRPPQVLLASLSSVVGIWWRGSVSHSCPCHRTRSIFKRGWVVSALRALSERRCDFNPFICLARESL